MPSTTFWYLNLNRTTIATPNKDDVLEHARRDEDYQCRVVHADFDANRSDNGFVQTCITVHGPAGFNLRSLAP